MDFPQYRKLSNNKVFYRIISEREFEEIQIIGFKSVFHRIKASQYPEIIKINDMLTVQAPYYMVSNAIEFEKALNLGN
jgi:hypothetical protein